MAEAIFSYLLDVKNMYFFCADCTREIFGIRALSKGSLPIINIARIVISVFTRDEKSELNSTDTNLAPKN